MSRDVVNGYVHRPDQLYVAASSTEVGRVREFMRLARAAGWQITHDWTAVIDAAGGEANPASATTEQQVEWSDGDIRGVVSADVVVLLQPRDGASARGAYFEFGYATAMDRHTVAVSSPVAVSIFNAKATEVVPEDVDALASLGRIARAGIRERAR